MPSQPAHISLIHRRCPRPSSRQDRRPVHQPEPHPLTFPPYQELHSGTLAQPTVCPPVTVRGGGVPPVSWTPERLVGTVRPGEEDVRQCRRDRTFRSRIRRSSGVKLWSCTGGPG